MCHAASDISVAGEGVAVLSHGFSSMYLATTSFFNGTFLSFSFFSLIILAYDMMERRLDDYVRLMTKGEKTRRLKHKSLNCKKGYSGGMMLFSWRFLGRQQ